MRWEKRKEGRDLGRGGGGGGEACDTQGGGRAGAIAAGGCSLGTLGLGYLDTRAGSPVCYRGPLGESNAVLFWVALRLQTETERGKTCISLHAFLIVQALPSLDEGDPVCR